MACLSSLIFQASCLTDLAPTVCFAFAHRPGCRASGADPSAHLDKSLRIYVLSCNPNLITRVGACQAVLKALTQTATFLVSSYA